MIAGNSCSLWALAVFLFITKSSVVMDSTQCQGLEDKTVNCFIQEKPDDNVLPV